MENNNSVVPETETTEEVFICEHCGCSISQSDVKVGSDGQDYCITCFEEYFITCDRCNELNEKDDINWVDNDPICQSCFERYGYFCCESCEENYRVNEYGSDGRCNDCYNDSYEEDENYPQYNRKYDKSDKLVDPNERAFSCEIECYYPERKYENVGEVIDEINESIGLSDDGSLNSCGKEFQTPKLSGVAGRKVLKQLCKSLNDNEFFVNRTCGLHIHLDTSDIAGNTRRMRDLILFYMAIEPVLYSYLPFSRRTNRFCMPLSQFYQETELKNINTISDIEKIWYREQSLISIECRKKEKYDRSRYAGVNLHSMLSNGHIEIRHHSGTLDYTKIQNWIDLHLAILNAISNNDIRLEEILKIKYILNLSQKQDKMFEMLKLDEKLQKYFIARNRKFGNELKDDENICVE